MNNNNNTQATKNIPYVVSIVLIVSLFFMWGVANNLNDILIKQFKNAFELTDLQSGLVQSAFYFGYFTFAIPAALLMRRKGYKSAIITGLVLYAIGAFMFWPAGNAQSYTFFLVSLYIIACGLTFLETSANPLVVSMGTPETAARRLNLAQAFNPLGSIVGVFIGRQFIFSDVEFSAEQIAAMSALERDAYYLQEAQAVQIPYFVIGCVVLAWAVMMFFTSFPVVHDDDREGDGSIKQFWQAAKRKSLSAAVIAQFFYVGAQVGVWSYIIRYAQTAVPTMSERAAAEYLMAALVAFLAGRFISTALMRFLAPLVMLTAYSAANVALMAYVAVAPTQTGLIALVASSFFMSVMYPTIFATGIHGLGTLTKSGSSLIVMAIIGGAVLTAMMGYVSDIAGIEKAFLIPLVSFAVVGGFAMLNLKIKNSV